MVDIEKARADLATAQSRLEEAGKLAGQLLIDDRFDPELVSLMHDLIAQLGLILNSIRFAQRQLDNDT